MNGDGYEVRILKFSENITLATSMRELNPQVAIIPFNYTEKLMVTVNELETETGRLRLSIKGIPERNMDPSKK